VSTDVQDPPSVWRQLGVLLEREHNQISARFDKVDQRFDKVDQRFDKVEQRLSNVEGQLGRLETATAKGFDRVHADIERLVGLIKQDELKPRPRRR
jgi:DNA anti-recombination protein RmuC